jgi:hypothetical protein
VSEPAPDTVPLADQFREHARWCAAAGAPLYAHLMRGFAADWDAGGAVRTLCAPWEGAPRGHVVQLRLLGALHRIVLRREAPLLATHYRSVGGTAPPAGAWPLARAVLHERAADLAGELLVAPQTNETGRAAALVAGVLHACARYGRSRVRLLEVGTSAGLLLNLDRIRATGEGWQWGPPGSPVDLSGTVRGPLSQASLAVARAGVEVVDARGCDLDPVDPTSVQGRLHLTSFVWPDHVQRFERLRAALDLAGRFPVRTDAADAAVWLPQRLDEPVEDDVLTVVWHSVVRQYVAPEVWRRVESAVVEAGSRAPVAHVSLEPPTALYLAPAELSVDGARIGSAPAHGVPVELDG